MEDTDYVKSRDALARLVEDLGKEPAIADVTITRQGAEAAEAGEVPVAKELAALRERLADERFRIGLYTTSQRGKSTTFNALFGGQELSPRGQGTPTSAAIVVGVPTRDPGRVGKATVTWKSKEELLLSLKAGLIAPYLPKGLLAEGQTLDDLDLERDVDLRALCDAVEDAWRAHKRQRTLSGVDYDQLRIAYVMLHHYGNPTLREQWARPKETLYDAEAVAGIVRYPDHWEEHFDTPDLPADFRDEETLFLFVKQVTLYVDAATLGDAACAVVDCPGFGANHYDTRVAEEALGACDLVWVLLGETVIGEPEEEKIKELAGIKADALLFAVNMRGDRETGKREHFREVIVPTDVSKLGKVLPKGATVAEADILLYQARLALVAEQAARLREGRLPEAALAAIVRHVREGKDRCKTTAEALDALGKLAKKDLYNLGGLKRAERDMLTFEGEEGAQWVARAREAGGLEDVRARIVAIVRGQRIGRILRDNVCARLCTAFGAVSRANRRRLEGLQGGAEAEEKRIAAKEKELQELERRVKALFGAGRQLRTKLRDGLRRELQSAVYSPAVDAILAEARRECAALADKNDDQRQAWFNTVGKRQVETKWKAWQVKVKAGGSPALSAYLAAIQEQVGDLLKEVATDKTDFPGMAGTDAPEAKMGNLAVDLGIDWGFWLGALDVASLGLFAIPGIGWVAKGAISLAIWASSWLGGKALAERRADKMREAVNNEIAPKLREDFQESAEEMAGKMAEATAERVREAIDGQIADYRRKLKQELVRLRKDLAGERDKVDAEIAFRAEALKRLEAFGQRLQAARRDLEAACNALAARSAS